MAKELAVKDNAYDMSIYEDSDKLLTKVSQSFNTEFETMTPEKITKIGEGLAEFHRAIKTSARKNSQNTLQMMTLTMLTDSPYRRLRQILLQIEKRKTAMEDYYLKHLKSVHLMEKLRSKTGVMNELRLKQMELTIERNKPYIEASLKEIGLLQETYEEIKQANGIRDDWDEEDFENSEIEHHIRQSFRQAHRDVSLTGAISQGNAEYLEQYGIHLQVANKLIRDYIGTCNDMMINENMTPDITHLYKFLDDCVKVFGNEYIKTLEHIGIKDVTKQNFLFKSNLGSTK